MEIIGVNRINVIIRNVVNDSMTEDSEKLNKIVYINYGMNLISKKGLFILIRALKKNDRIIVHWIGSDVFQLIQNTIKSKIKRILLLLITKLFKVRHWVAAPLLKNELNDYGILSDVVYIPTELIKEVEITELPKEPSFVSYLPEINHEFYGSHIIFRFAKKNPNITIHVVANNGNGLPKLDNIIYHGWVNEATMDQIYKNTYGVIRIPKHDALGGTVIEAVLRGRYAVWTFDAPYTYKCESYTDLENAIYKILEKKEPNYNGANYIKSHYSYEKLKNEFISKINEA